MMTPKGVDLLMLSNRFFQFGKRSYADNGLRFADAQESRFQRRKRSYIRSAVLRGDRFDGVQELRFWTTEPSDMDCAKLHGGLLANC